MIQRPRRNRKSAAVRSLIEETVLRPADFVAPLFVIEGEKKREQVATMPGVERFSIDLLLEEIDTLHKLGVLGIALFPSLSYELRDDEAKEALNPDNLLLRAVKEIKRRFPELCLFTDIALDAYTSHGHDGIVIDGDVHNDATVEVLKKMALLHAKSGVDFVAPSDMMDGRILAIRKTLDEEGFSHVGILSYCAKYASALYAPYRDALQSKNRGLNKKTYQMNPANVREAMRQTKIDEEQGADMLIVKPASLYLDIIRAMKEQTDLPICAFHVSGEYAMVMAAHEKEILEADKIFYETLLGIKRAGADFIISYAAKRIVQKLE